MKFDAFIIGVQKAGTSSLKDLLSQHSNIVTHYTHEFCYFNDENYNTDDYPVWIKEHFGEKSQNNKEVILGKNVDLFVSKKALQRLKSNNPDIKIIICLRDPIKRIISAYDYLFYRGVESEKDFSKAIRLENRSINNPHKFRSLNYLDTSSYCKNLDVVHSIFDSDKILILKFEDLISDPQLILKQVFDFLNIEPQKIDTSKKSNQGKTAISPTLNRIFHSKNIFLKKIWKSISPENRTKLKNSFLRLNSRKKSKKTELSLNDAKYLRTKLKQDKELLKSKYGISFE